MKFGTISIGAAIAGAIVAATLVVSRHADKPTGAAAAPAAAAGRLGDIVVYKSPTCGCCEGWIEHLKAAGFRVEARDTSDVGAVKRRLGVLPSLVSCHTAIVAHYVIEGHVPADDIVRMLEEQPKITGLAVAGMPAGSPGMESLHPVPYDVIAFDAQGHTEVYARH